MKKRTRNHWNLVPGEYFSVKKRNSNHEDSNLDKQKEKKKADAILQQEESSELEQLNAQS